jgi:hypothetical protein
VGDRINLLVKYLVEESVPLLPVILEDARDSLACPSAPSRPKPRSENVLRIARGRRKQERVVAKSHIELPRGVVVRTYLFRRTGLYTPANCMIGYYIPCQASKDSEH